VKKGESLFGEEGKNPPQPLHEGGALEKAKKRALRLLKIRGRSVREMTERLEGAGIAGAIIERVIADLSRAGLMGDERLAASLIYETTARVPAGEKMIRARLEGRGLEVESRSGEIEAAAGKLEDAVKLARERVAKMKGVAKGDARRRVASLLARRGFDEEVVEEAVWRVLGNEIEAEG
jgi:SOS response regulatory protein OraA/RecX